MKWGSIVGVRVCGYIKIKDTTAEEGERGMTTRGRGKGYDNKGKGEEV